MHMNEFHSITTQLSMPQEEIVKRGGIENAVAWHFHKLGYRCIARENDTISTLWGLICLEPILWIPSWDIWNQSKSPADYPEILSESSDPERTIWHEHPQPFSWIYSKDCFNLNGYPTTLPDGTHYRLMKNEIDNFIKNLDKGSIAENIRSNDHYIRNEMKHEYRRTPRILLTYPWDSASLDSLRDDYAQDIIRLAEALPLDAVKYICKSFFQNWHQNRTGFPDLWLIENAGLLELVEVKRLRERIQKNQRRWISILMDFGVSVAIVRVRII